MQALDVADVDGRVDVDTGLEQLIDILTAPAVAAALRILMGQLIDKDERGPAQERTVEVEFLLIADAQGRQAGKAALQRARLRRGMRGDVAHQHVHALFLGGAGGLEHRLRLADALRVAEEDFQLSLFALRHVRHLRVFLLL